ncbi:isocitrate lyase/PEP mutase family protein [Chitinophaga tropicalis]|uniref:Isocitrate lyase/phosphoenolpyruvate mutase family protein n=1 Tax=Chitinophaga tropicalis TaxID=2683588 RepID=A0A7K1U7J6_9BACT|nr:isocitrate lyase/phosphoenolpyruvate mutase family protein [Chitinophaga tropicalis]MVT10317.1 isocitrate lyase/phosphoenolpyruvate mutase family protein [Chitinophaga tropicalis]
MASQFTRFKDLHHTSDLFILPNVWDAKIALSFQDEKFSAIATSSSAVAGALGFEDGEKMTFNDYLFVINRILSVVNIPLTVDIEMGYGSSDEKVQENILTLAGMGVVGINIEDSTINSSGRELKDATTFAKTVEHLKNRLVSENAELFINVRCDTYILNVANKQQETAERIKLYETAGADGIFLPCISAEEDIAAAVAGTSLPLNVMCIPGLPDFDRLKALGVKRISMGPFLFSKAYENVSQLSRAVTAAKSFLPLFS